MTMTRYVSSASHIRGLMRFRILPFALLAVTVPGCDSVLDVKPADEVPVERSIVDANSARAAARGIYDALQSTNYYGGDYLFFNDLSSDDVIHTGTFTSYADADDNNLTADNSAVSSIWDAIYRGIGRANLVLQKVPDVTGLDDSERDQILGEAHFLRALMYHDLVKTFGGRNPGDLGVPIRLTPPAGVEETIGVTRATVGAVYTQIHADLNAAAGLITESATRRVSLAAVRALRARVHLYQGNYAAAESEAAFVLAQGFTLADRYSDLFSPEGTDTQEDILRLTYTVTDANTVGYYYISKSFGGRREIAPSSGLFAAYSSADTRRNHNIRFDPRNRRYGAKYPTTTGAEDLHIIRLAEVILIKAEAHAQQGELIEALIEVNKIRRRAGLADFVSANQAAIIAEIIHQRRLELAMEGHRWPDLVRLNLAVSVLGLSSRPYQTIYPIPQSEFDVTNGTISQNPGY